MRRYDKAATRGDNPFIADFLSNNNDTFECGEDTLSKYAAITPTIYLRYQTTVL